MSLPVPDLIAGFDLKSMILRLATAADLPTLASIHKQAYSRNHFTALLPNETLERFYGFFLRHGIEVLLATHQDAEGNETTLGFAVYGQGIPEQISLFKRAASRDILITSLRHPLHAVRKLTEMFGAKLDAGVSIQPADFLLLSIAVIHKRGGIGGRLLRAMLVDAHRAGVRTVGLYVNADNLAAINAYFAAGFVLRHYLSRQFYMEVKCG